MSNKITDSAVYWDRTILFDIVSKIIKLTAPKIVVEEDGYQPDFDNNQYIITPNHGAVPEDIRIAIGCLDADIVIATQYGLEKNPDLKFVCNWRGGVIGFLRSSKSSRRDSRNKMYSSLESGNSLVIFPTGSFNNSMNEVVPPIFSGAIEQSIKTEELLETGVPLLPLAMIKDSEGVVHIKYGEPVVYSLDDCVDGVDQLTENYRGIMAGLYYDLIEKYSSPNVMSIKEFDSSTGETIESQYYYTKRSTLIDEMIDEIVEYPKLSKDMKELFEFFREIYNAPYSIKWRDSDIIDKYSKNGYLEKVFEMLLSLRDETDIKKIITSLVFFEIRRQALMTASPFKLDDVDEVIKTVKDEVNAHHRFFEPYTIEIEGEEDGIINNDHYIEVLKSLSDFDYDTEMATSFEEIINTDFYHTEDGEIEADGFILYLIGIGLAPNRINAISRKYSK